MLATGLAAFLLAQADPGAAVCDAVKSAQMAEEARRAVSARQFDTAAIQFQNAFYACPLNRNLLIEHANALFMARRFADARLAAKRILDAEPGNAAALKIKGNAAYFLNALDEAVSTFITLLDRHPEDEEGAYMLGRIYYQEGLLDQAIGQFQRVLKVNPQSYKAWDNLGLCWEARGDTQKATAHFLHAIQLVEKDHPEYDWAYSNLADLLLKTGDAEHAFAAASKAANRNPASARNFYIGAKALSELGKDELSLNWAQRSAALDPNYSEAQYLLARVYRRLGQQEKAQEAQKKFLDLKAKEPNKRR
jgi:tetratricopeptide (TPR) repeat protein